MTGAEHSCFAVQLCITSTARRISSIRLLIAQLPQLLNRILVFSLSGPRYFFLRARRDEMSICLFEQSESFHGLDRLLQLSLSRSSVQIAIIGGGAAGFFAAITCAHADPAND